jgi:hypothetical protein
VSGDAVRWSFEAPLAVVGTATRDGKVLLPPMPGERRQWLAWLPVPVFGFTRVSRRPDRREPDEWEAPLPVAVIERVELRGAELMATGHFGDTERGRHYAGALAVEAVWLGLGADRSEMEPMYRATAFRGWRIREATLVDSPAWDLSLLSCPRVWQEEIPAG